MRKIFNESYNEMRALGMTEQLYRESPDNLLFQSAVSNDSGYYISSCSRLDMLWEAPKAALSLSNLMLGLTVIQKQMP